MDVEKLIQAARCCTLGGEGCDKCPMNDYIGKCSLARHSLTARKICEISDYYEQKLMLLREDINLLQRTMRTHKDVIADYKRQLEESKALLKAERSKAVQEVREWIEEAKPNAKEHLPWRYESICVAYDELEVQCLSKLDSMEPDKEEPNVLAD